MTFALAGRRVLVTRVAGFREKPVFEAVRSFFPAALLVPRKVEYELTSRPRTHPDHDYRSFLSRT